MFHREDGACKCDKRPKQELIATKTETWTRRHVESPIKYSKRDSALTKAIVPKAQARGHRTAHALSNNTGGFRNGQDDQEPC